ncbi:MAG: glycosyltransferase family 39 protein [Candidatus Aureabacteria bacterium]|nr:glycosyltransferase family 39 protein [Candidatus Auribacterota bacterium]
MMDTILGLAKNYPLYIQGAGRWIYDLCATHPTSIKFGVIFFVVVMCLCAFFRARRSYGTLIWIIGAIGCAYLAQVYIMENYLLRGTLLYLEAAILMFTYCAMVKGEYGASEIVIGKRATIVLMGFIILGASFFRFYRLADYPDAVINDEALNLQCGVYAMRGEIKELGPVWSEASLHCFTLYSEAFFFKLFGVSLFAGRMAMAVPGILGIVAFFLMTDMLFPRAVALLAASFLATCYCSVEYDRLASGINQGTLFACASFYLLLLAERKKSVLCGLLSGAALGLGLGTFYTFVGVILVFISFIAYRIIFERGFLRKNWVILVLVLIGFLAVASQQLQQQIQHAIGYIRSGFLFFGHPVQLPSSVPSQTDLLLRNIGLLARMLFLSMGESIFLISELPMANVFLVPLFVLGGICALYCFKRYNYFLVLVWFVLGPIAGFLTEPNDYRIIAFLPAVYILAALGAFLLLKVIISSLRINGYLVFVSLLALMSTAILAVNVYVYFNKCRTTAGFEDKEIGEYANSRIGKNFIYFVDFGTPANPYVLTYESRRGEDPQKYYSIITRDEVYSAIFNKPSGGLDRMFIFYKSEENSKFVEDVAKAMPYAKVELKQYLISCMLPENKLAKERGSDVAYQTAFQETAPGQWARARAVSTEFDWGHYSIQYPFRIETEGNFCVPKDDTYYFRSIGGGDTEVYIDGKQVSLTPSPCVLKSGVHRIRLRHLQATPGKFSLTWRRGEEQEAPVYIWGAVLKNLFDLAATPAPTRTPGQE